MSNDELRLRTLSRLTGTIDELVKEDPALRQLDFIIIAYADGVYSWSTTASVEQTRAVLEGVCAHFTVADEVTMVQ